jgi:hypothetical protein
MRASIVAIFPSYTSNIQLSTKSITLNFNNHILSQLGAEVTLPEFMSALEGTSSQVCASVNPDCIRERDVILMITLIPNSQFASKHPIFQ